MDPNNVIPPPIEKYENAITLQEIGEDGAVYLAEVCTDDELEMLSNYVIGDYQIAKDAIVIKESE